VKKPILVVTTRFVKPIETRIDNEFEVRRKADGTPFQHDELLAAAEGADALCTTHKKCFQGIMAQPAWHTTSTHSSNARAYNIQSLRAGQKPVHNSLRSAVDQLPLQYFLE